MLARADSSPLRDSSPATFAVNAKKRKHASTTAASSPAPSDIPENIVLPVRNDIASRPRLTISRHPVFVQDAQGPYHTTEQLAINRMGFRYTHAGVAPLGSVSPFRTIESAPTSYRVSWEDRSPLIKVTTDGLGLAGDKGFRSARCNAPIREGQWYLEVKVEHGGGEQLPDSASSSQGSHVRLGWARREAPLNGPAGLDGYSYSVRDKTGEKVTLSRRRQYGRPFSSGDVVGMYISLPPHRQPDSRDPHDPAHIKRERIPIEFKGQEYFESLEYPQSKEMIALMDYPGKSSKFLPSSSKKSATVKNLPERGRSKQSVPEPAPLRPLPILPESYIAFFINGECQGIAFRDLYDFLPLRSTQASRKGKEKKRNREGLEHKENPFDDGSLGYYPFISLFNDAKVRINPGPDFIYAPPPDIDAVCTGREPLDTKDSTWRPICERYAHYMEEQWALDAIDEAEAKVQAVHREAAEKEEAEKRAQREKKRLQAEARKKAKKEAVGQTQQRELSAVEDDRFGPSLSAAELDHRYGYMSSEQVHSPAPTVASSMDIHTGTYDADPSENEEAFGDAPTPYYEPVMQQHYFWQDPSQNLAEPP